MGSASDGAYALAVQADGKIVVAGETTRAGTLGDFAVARYNPDGSLDSGFAAAGRLVTDIAGATDQAKAVALASDGKIVVAGWATVGGMPQFALVRFTGTGALDGSFGPAATGKVTSSFPSGFSRAHSLAILPGGSIVVAGDVFSFSGDGSDFGVARYSSSGILDSTFGAGGWAQVDFAGGSDESAASVAVQSDGKLVLAGSHYNWEAEVEDFAVARLGSNGTLDTTFGGGGTVLTDFDGASDIATSVLVQGDGKIVVAGMATVSDEMRFGLARYTGAGALDTSFAGTGRASLRFAATGPGGGAFANAVAADAQGQLVVGGFTNGSSSGSYDFAVARVIGHENVAPTANPGGPYVVAEGGSVQLAGGGSSDADGSIVSYEWDFNYDGSTFGVDATGATPTFSAANLEGPLVRTVALRVTDSEGATHLATTTVSVLDVAPPVPAPEPTPEPTPEPDPDPVPLPAPGSAVLEDDPSSPGRKMLVFHGTARHDRVAFRLVKRGMLEVRLNGKKLGSFAGVSRIVALGGDGKDVIDARGASVPAELFGGKGNDKLFGSRFNDILVGGEGNDHLFGCKGNDLIVGGMGKDDLHSRRGNDLLIAGGLTFEDDPASLRSILATWTRTDVSLKQRVASLMLSGEGAKVDKSTLVDDGARDRLHGTACADWLIPGAGDKVKKIKSH
jgi:uncharacterized delta-60 repeat protein